MLFMKMEQEEGKSDQRILDRVIEVWNLDEKEYKERVGNQEIERESPIGAKGVNLEYSWKDRQLINQIIRQQI